MRASRRLVDGAESDAVSAVGSPVPPDAERRRLVLGGSADRGGGGADRRRHRRTNWETAQSSGTDGDAVASETSVPTATRSTPVGRRRDTARRRHPGRALAADGTNRPERGRRVWSATVTPTWSSSDASTCIQPCRRSGSRSSRSRTEVRRVRIDTATGAIVTVDVDGAQFGPPTVFAGDGWILVPSSDGVRGSTVLFDDGSRSSIDTGFAWTLLTTGDGRRRSGAAMVRRAERFPDRLVEMAIDGEPTGIGDRSERFHPANARSARRRGGRRTRWFVRADRRSRRPG